jgi:hypothetical protein
MKVKETQPREAFLAIISEISIYSVFTGWSRRSAARTARRRAVVNCVACSLLIHTFVSVAGRAAVRRCAWLDKYIDMRSFQSPEALSFAPRKYSHRRMSRGQALVSRGFAHARGISPHA